MLKEKKKVTGAWLVEAGSSSSRIALSTLAGTCVCAECLLFGVAVLSNRGLVLFLALDI